MNDDPSDSTLSRDQAERTVITRPSTAAAAALARIGHYLTYQIDGALHRTAIVPAGLVLGRQAPASLELPDGEVSRRHCRVDINGGAAQVTDLGSTNGTFVGDVRVNRPTELGNGAQLRVGPFVLRYEQRDLEEVLQAETLATELRQAVEYMRAILPEPISTGPVQAQWWYVPSSHLGGDAFGYQMLDDGSFAGFLLDVSGHGIGPAMHAVAVANVLRRRGLPNIDFADPAQVTAGLNAMFPMEAHNGMLLTLWCFAYTPSRRELTYCSAGHHPGFLRLPGQAAVQPLAARGPMIGMMPHGTWETGRVVVPPGSRLYLCSDGAYEISTHHGVPWQLADLQRIIEQPDVPDTLEVLRVYQAVRSAAPSGPLQDDCTLLMLSFE